MVRAGIGWRDRPAAAWLAAGLWTAVVLTLSGDSFSADSTSRFLGPLLRWLLPGLSPEGLAAVHTAVRKGAHVFEYGVLALLAARAAARSWGRAPALPAAAALAIVLAVAGVDESRQARSGARTGAASDVALDCAGGAAALLLRAALLRRGTALPRRGTALPRRGRRERARRTGPGAERRG